MDIFFDLNESRFERKFVNSYFDINQTEQIIKMHPALFSEIHNRRYINNIYFDSPSLENYYENSFGKAVRSKARIRWYGDLFQKIENPVLEIKNKNGLTGYKQSFDLPSFEFTKKFDSSQLKEIFLQANLPNDIYNKLLKSIPTLVNRYSRKYFKDFSRNFRLTTDTDINYYNIRAGKNFINHKYTDNKNIIIELKYDFDKDEKAKFITEKLPFRLTKNSKYVNGIELFNNIAI